MRILASPAFANRATNPYNAALYTALQAHGAEVAEWSACRVWRETWDIVHLHWPDGVLHARAATRAAAGVANLLAKLLCVKARGAKIVWTVHNLQAHATAHPGLERAFWRAFVPLVDAAISLSHSGKSLAEERHPALAGKPHFVVPHGHYRDCYRNDCTRAEARRRVGLPARGPVIAFVGQIKPYKNVPALVRAFIEMSGPTPDATLLVAGKVSDAALLAEIARLAASRVNIAHRFGHIADDDMQYALNACDLAVFPYREILNSGSAILALSFNRPVLVPAKGAMADLRELVGPEWVMTYEGELTGATLREACRWSVETRRPVKCDLSPLGWETVAAQTLAAYRAATSSTASVLPLTSAQTSLP